MENQTQQQSTVTSEPSTVPVATPSTAHSSPNSFLIILLSILLLISVSIAVFFAYQTQKLVKELNLLKVTPTPVANVEPTVEPIATNSASATPDQTANWKTYTNLDLKFTLTLPDSWKDKYRVVVDNNVVYFEYKAVQEEPYKIFWITRITPAQWNSIQSDTTVAHQTEKIFSNDQYVFYPNQSLDNPYTMNKNIDAYTNMAKDIKQILSTFKFTN